MKHFWKQSAAAMLAGALLLGGCGSGSSEDAVSVQSVSDLMGVNVSGVNEYAGVVKSHAAQKIKKSSSKKVAKCYVKKGDVVKKGDPLFKYDTSSIQLDLESMELEIERMEGNIESYSSQISELEKERSKASANKKLSYSLEIQEAQLDQQEEKYNLEKKKKEYKKKKKSLNHTVVHSKISGVVQSVDDSSDSNTYITIQGNTAYRVKGTISETNVSSIQEGEAVQVLSRVNDDSWTGTISRIDTDQAQKSDSSDEDMGIDTGGESATKYSFYVTLDSSDGLLMGQHVYIKAGSDVSEEEANAILLPSAYLVSDDEGETYYVWAETKRHKLEKRAVTVGEYNEFTDTYPILSGLTEEDYIAAPEDGLEEGDKTKEYTQEDAAADESTDEEAADDGYQEGEVPAMTTEEVQ